MNFNVYINKQTGDRISKIALKLHRSRNSIVNEALEEWLNNQSKNAWPSKFFEFEPIEDFPDVRSLRKDLKDISEDPLA